MGVRVDGSPLRGIRYVDGRYTAQAAFRDGPGLGVRRTALHAALARRAAELGVEVIPGRIDGLRQRHDEVEAAGLRARWLVAADGLHSPLRALLGLGLPTARPARYGLRRHYAVTPWTDYVEVHWAPGGEAYVTPVGDDLVGVAVLSSRRCGYADHLAEFPALVDRLDSRPAGRLDDPPGCRRDGPAATRVRGAGPLRQRVRSRVAGRVLLVGDAAGYMDALTGEGVSLALLSAEALVRCLRSGRPQAYEAAWRRLSLRHRLLTGALLEARPHAGPALLTVPAAQRLPAVFAAAVRALA
jgi:flavin-dependent dehydrogenase